MKNAVQLYFILSCLMISWFSISMQAQTNNIDVKIQYLSSDNLTWGVFMKPSSGFEQASSDLLIVSGRVTLFMRNNGQDDLLNIKSVNGRWSPNYSIASGPVEAPDLTYFTVDLASSGSYVTLENGQETLLFTFQSSNCPDTIGLIDNYKDAFANTPNSLGTDASMNLTLYHTRKNESYYWNSNYALHAASCQDCDQDGIVDALEDTNGDGVFTPNVDASNLCDNEDLNTLPQAPQRACITVNDVILTNPSECGGGDGSITIDAVHEFGNPLQYSLDGGRVWVNSSTIGNLEAGVIYRLELRDFLGLCFESYGTIELIHTECNNVCATNSFSIPNYPDQDICVGASTQLNIVGGNTYSWSPSNGLSNTTIANPTANPSSTTTYTVTVTNSEGCTATDDITINVSENLVVNAGADVTICTGSSTTLSTSGGRSYSWNPTTGLSNPSIANPTASPSTTTTYSVTVSDAIGCTGVDQVVVNIAEANLTVDAGADRIVCPNEATTLNASGGSTYSWSPAEGLSSTTVPNPTLTIDRPVLYCVTVRDANGCSASDCLEIQIESNCEAEGGNNDESEGNVNCTVLACQDKIICPTGQTQLVVNGGTRWEWTPATGLDDPFSPIPIASPSSTTTYTVTGWFEDGCFGTEEVLVTVDPNKPCDSTPTPCIEDVIPEDRICIDQNDDFVDVCLAFSEEELTQYTITVGGAVPSVVHGCNFNALVGYQYNLLPSQTDNYKVKSWQINGTYHTGMFNTLQELVTWMQSTDPTGNWILSPTSSSIIGGNTANTYQALILIHEASSMEIGLLPNRTQTPTGTLVKVDMAGKNTETLTVVEVATGCTDEVVIERCN